MPRVDLAELVTAAEIGRRLDVSRQRAQQLAQQDGFPDPLGRVGNYTVFRWKDVERWAREHGRPLNGSTKPKTGASSP